MKDVDKSVAARGRNLLALAAGVPLFLGGLVAALGIARPTGALVFDLLKLAIFSFFVWKAFEGSRTAPLFLAVVLAMGGLWDLLFMALQGIFSPIGAVIDVVLLSCAWLLWKSPAIREYQRGRRKRAPVGSDRHRPVRRKGVL